jgi:hypothetical protein
VLVIESRSGDRIFESVELNDHKVLTTFSEADARVLRSVSTPRQERGASVLSAALAFF